jgi:hypothetical protein
VVSACIGSGWAILIADLLQASGDRPSPIRCLDWGAVLADIARRDGPDGGRLPRINRLVRVLRGLRDPFTIIN